MFLKGTYSRVQLANRIKVRSERNSCHIEISQMIWKVNHWFVYDMSLLKGISEQIIGTTTLQERIQ